MSRLVPFFVPSVIQSSKSFPAATVLAENTSLFSPTGAKAVKKPGNCNPGTGIVPAGEPSVIQRFATSPVWFEMI